jgi:uridine kinase/anti-sigma regulatory factor (Ser/Thr protein kinase)
MYCVEVNYLPEEEEVEWLLNLAGDNSAAVREDITTLVRYTNSLRKQGQGPSLRTLERIVQSLKQYPQQDPVKLLMREMGMPLRPKGYGAALETALASKAFGQAIREAWEQGARLSIASFGQDIVPAVVETTVPVVPQSISTVNEAVPPAAETSAAPERKTGTAARLWKHIRSLISLSVNLAATGREGDGEAYNPLEWWKYRNPSFQKQRIARQRRDVLEKVMHIVTGLNIPLKAWYQLPGELGRMKTWRCIWDRETMEPREMNFVADDLIEPKSEESVLGVLYHELFELLYRHPESTDQAFLRKPGAAFLNNAIGDLWINLQGMNDFRGSSDWLKVLYREECAPLRFGDLNATREALAKQPLYAQFCFGMIYEWTYGSSDPRIVNAEVREAMETLREKTVAVYSAPTVADHVAGMRDLYDDPAFQKLVGQSIEDKAQADVEGDGDGESQTGEGKDGEGGTVKERPAPAEDADRIPWETLSDQEKQKALEKLRESWERLSEEEKEALRKTAAEELARKDLNTPGIQQPLMMDEDGTPLDEQQAKQALEKMQQRKEQADREQQEYEEQQELRRMEEEEESAKAAAEEREREGLNRTEQDDFNDRYERVHGDIGRMRTVFRKFYQRQRGYFQRWLERGLLDDAALPLAVAGEDRIFKKRKEPKQYKVRISLLIDQSGSMGGDKINAVADAVLMMLEAIKDDQKKGITLEVVGFHDDKAAEIYFPYGEKLSKQRVVGVIGEVVRTYGGNNDLRAMYHAFKRVPANERNTLNLLIHFSDGDPNFQFSRERFREWINSRPHMTVVGLGIGAEAELILDLYPKGQGAWAPNSSEVPERLAGILLNFVSRHGRNGPETKRFSEQDIIESELLTRTAVGKPADDECRSGLIGKVFRQPGGEVVSGGLSFTFAGGELVPAAEIYDKQGIRIESLSAAAMASGSGDVKAQLAERIRARLPGLSGNDRINAEAILARLDGVEIMELQDNRHGVLGIPDPGHGRIFLHGSLVSPVGIFHEIGEGFPDSEHIPALCSMHTYLRGAGANARGAYAALGTAETTSETVLIPALEREMRRRLTRQEKALISYNMNCGYGGSPLDGLQDKIFGQEENGNFTCAVQAVAASANAVERRAAEWILRETGASGITRISLEKMYRNEVRDAIRQGQVVALVPGSTRARISEYLKHRFAHAVSANPGEDRYKNVKARFAEFAEYINETFHMQFGMVVTGDFIMGLQFPLMEMIKNAFVHGNRLDPALPMYLYLDPAKREITVYNIVQNGEKAFLADLADAKNAKLYGEQKGISIMKGAEAPHLTLIPGMKMSYKDSNDPEIGLRRIPGLPEITLYEARVGFTRDTGIPATAVDNIIDQGVTAFRYADDIELDPAALGDILTRDMNRKPLFNVGPLAVLAGAAVEAALALTGMDGVRGIAGTISLLLAPYMAWRLPLALGLLRKAAAPYELADLREDLRKVEGVRLKIPGEWHNWINGETEEIPADLRKLRIKTLTTSPLRLALLGGSVAQYSPKENTLYLPRNMKSLPDKARLRIIRHEMAHYFGSRIDKGFWRQVPVLGWLLDEAAALQVEMATVTDRPAGQIPQQREVLSTAERIGTDAGVDGITEIGLSLTERELMPGGALGKDLVEAVDGNNLIVLRMGTPENPADRIASYRKVADIFEAMASCLNETFHEKYGISRTGRDELGIRFAIQEMLKNAFLHGNKLDFSAPIYFHMDLKARTIAVYNEENRSVELTPDERKDARKTILGGGGQAVAIMEGKVDMPWQRMPIERDAENVRMVYEQGIAHSLEGIFKAQVAFVPVASPAMSLSGSADAGQRVNKVSLERIPVPDASYISFDGLERLGGVSLVAGIALLTAAVVVVGGSDAGLTTFAQTIISSAGASVLGGMGWIMRRSEDLLGMFQFVKRQFDSGRDPQVEGKSDIAILDEYDPASPGMQKILGRLIPSLRTIAELQISRRQDYMDTWGPIKVKNGDVMMDILAFANLHTAFPAWLGDPARILLAKAVQWFYGFAAHEYLHRIGWDRGHVLPYAMNALPGAGILVVGAGMLVGLTLPGMLCMVAGIFLLGTHTLVTLLATASLHKEQGWFGLRARSLGIPAGAFNALKIRGLGAAVDRLTSGIGTPGSEAQKKLTEWKQSQQYDRYRAFLQRTGAQAGFTGPALYYPFGGFDAFIPFALAPGITDVYSVGLERFGGIRDIITFFEQDGPLDERCCSFKDYESDTDISTIEDDYRISGFGALAVAQIITLLNARVTGIYYFAIEPDGTLSFSRNGTGMENAVIEFAGPDGIARRYWYFRDDLVKDDTGFQALAGRPDFAFQALLVKGMTDVWDEGRVEGREREILIEKTLAPAVRNHRNGGVAVLTDKRNNSADFMTPADGRRALWRDGYMPQVIPLAEDEQFGYNVNGYLFYGPADELLPAAQKSTQSPEDLMRYEAVAAGAENVFKTLVRRAGHEEGTPVIAVDGASGSGKSYFADRFKQFLEAEHRECAVIRLDWFLTERPERDKVIRGIREGTIPAAEAQELYYDMAAYHRLMRRIDDYRRLPGEPMTVSIPGVYNRVTGLRDQAVSLTISNRTVVLVEGVGCVDRETRPYFDAAVLCDAADPILLERMLDREQEKPQSLRLSNDYIAERFSLIDQPRTAILRSRIDTLHDYLLDTSDPRTSVLYAVPGRETAIARVNYADLISPLAGGIAANAVLETLMPGHQAPRRDQPPQHLRDITYMVTSSVYTPAVQERTAALGEQGMQTFGIAPRGPAQPTDGMMRLSDPAVEEYCSKAAVPVSGRPVLLDVYARKIMLRDGGSSWMLFYDAPANADAVALRAAPLAVAAWLRDNARAREILGIGEPFDIDIFETDDPAGYAPGSGGVSISLDRTALVLREAESGAFSAAAGSDGSAARRSFDAVVRDGELAGTLRTAGDLSRRNKDGLTFMAGDPVFSISVDAFRLPGGLTHMAGAPFMDELAEMAVDTLVLKFPRGSVARDGEAVGAVLREAHRRKKRVVIEIPVRGTSPADYAAAAREITGETAAGGEMFDGVRVDMAGLALSGADGAAVAAFLGAIRRSLDRTNPDALIGLILPEGCAFAAKEQQTIFETLGVKQVVQFLPGETPNLAGVRNGAWLEMGLERTTTQGVERFAAEADDVTAFKKRLDALFDAKNVGMFGMDFEIAHAGKLLFAESAGTTDFFAYCSGRINQVLRGFAREPQYCRRKGRHDAFLLDEQALAHFDEGAQAKALALVAACRGTTSPDDRTIAALHEVMLAASAAEKQDWMPETREDKDRYAAYAGGYLAGILENIAIRKYVPERRPFADARHKELFGRMVLEAQVFLQAPLPETVDGLIRSLRERGHQPSPELAALLERVRALDARLSSGARLADMHDELLALLGELEGTVNREGADPVAVAELLRLLDTYVDREEKGILDDLRRDTLEALPAAMKSIAGAA